MREIKFRGKHPKTGEWFYGWLTQLPSTGEFEIIDYGASGGGSCHYADPDTVGQFTGLLDSKGKEIFEGDILRFAPPLRWEDDEREVGVVVFKYYAFVVKYNDTSTGLFNLAANEAPYTIIGNIYDNPELLEATHD